MLGFKDFIAQDAHVFVNDAEFAITHKIDGLDVPVVVDDDRLKLRLKKDFEGLIIADILYFIKFSNMPARKFKSGDSQMFDGHAFTIVDVTENNGIYEVMLQRGVA